MNRFLKTSLVATLAITSIAGTSYAAGLAGRSAVAPSHDEMNGPGSIKLVSFDDSSSRKADHAIRHWKGGAFNVQPVGQIDDDATRTALQDRRTAEPREVAALQSAVEHNRALVAKLKAENVEIKNIVGADQALDGQLTLYVL